MLKGYARVSRVDQDLSAQVGELRSAGVADVTEERASGGGPLPLRDALLGSLQAGDVVVVVRLDRLGRSLRDLLAVVASLRAREVDLRSLRDGIDTRTAAGLLAVGVLGSVAEYERLLVSERTRAALASRRAAGQPVGRPRVLDAEKREAVEAMIREGVPHSRIARVHGISTRTVRRVAAELV